MRDDNITHYIYETVSMYEHFAVIFLVLIIICALLLHVLRCRGRNAAVVHGGKESAARSVNMFTRMQIGDIIGRGMWGTVYKITVDGKQYALKRKKILARNAKKLPQAVQIYNFAKSHGLADYFSKLWAHRIYRCTFIHTPPDHLAKNMEHSDFKAVSASPWCLELIMELGDKTFREYCAEDVEARKPLAARYRIIKQLLCIVRDLHAKKLFIDDFHAGNIIISGPDERVKLIDYDDMLYMDPRQMNKIESRKRILYALNYDLWSIIAMCLNLDVIFKKYFHVLEKLPSITDMLPYINKAGDWAKIRAYLGIICRDVPGVAQMFDEKPDSYWNNYGFLVDFIWSIVNEEANFEYWKKYVPAMKNDVPTFIPIKDLIFILDNYWNIDNIIAYFDGKK